MRYVTY